jgi:hypothetical protein
VLPGARLSNSRFLDLHHIELRSDGGPNEPGNLLTLCGVHHRAAHRGALLIERSTAQGIRYRSLGDGRLSVELSDVVLENALDATLRRPMAPGSIVGDWIERP